MKLIKLYIIVAIICCTSTAFGQEQDTKTLERQAREDVREGNDLYNELKFSEAEVAYKKALSKNPNYAKASYNLGNTVYQQNRNKEAVAQFELVEKTAVDKMSKAETYHNMGNSFMKEKQYAQAIDAYKKSMRNNSKDDETRYNLALAQKMLKDQQNQDNKDNKEDKDNKDEKENEGGDEEKKNDKDKEKDKGKDKEDDKGDDKKDEKNNEDQEKKEDQKPRPNQLTPEQMQQLLEAMNNEENKSQKKLNAEKAKGPKIKQEKDW